MEQYNVTGMSCAACSARVEKAVSAVPGVESCTVNLLTNSMGVEGTANQEAVIQAVVQAGYGASPKNGEVRIQTKPADESIPIKRRLTVSIVFLAVLMYFSMGHSMLGLPLPTIFDDNAIAVGLIQMILAATVMVINQRFFISGFRSIAMRAPNMDSLVALGSGTSFIWSIIQLFAMTLDIKNGDTEAVHTHLHNLYFESSAMILTLITIGKMLEARSKGKTTDALKSLMELAPKTATVEKNGTETVIPVEQVRVGDIFVVRPGESVPVDGIVTEGISAVNEASLTGESIPVDKASGDNVSAGTLNQSGFLKCTASRVGKDTTISQIIKMVSDAAATKAPIAKLADKVSGIFVPVVIAIAILTTIIWLAVGKEFAFALARGISVLVISCPCALGLATPVAIMVGSGVGARNGILFKTAVSLENTGKTNIVALDKTGTVTLGKPVATDLIPADGITEQELLSKAASLEHGSEHPIAAAIVNLAEQKKTEIHPVTDFESLTGSGLQARLNDTELKGGSMDFMSANCNISHSMKITADELASAGKTPVVFAEDDKVLGMIGIADVIKDDGGQAVEELRGMGIKVVMLTGDNKRTADAIGKQAGVDEVIAGVLPDGKEKVIRELRAEGSVTMVGDGINDAPALTRADNGIAIGAGTDVAIDAADIVLVKNRLRDVPAAIRLSRGVLRNIKENLFWAFIYNIIGIPLAAGLWIPITGWTLNPMFGAAAMSLSSFCVVSNALRLNLLDIHSSKHDKHIKTSTSGNRLSGTVTLKVKGMMCEHCEARVSKALEGLPGVSETRVSHKNGTAIVTLTGSTSVKELKKAVADAGYKVLSVQQNSFVNSESENS